MSKPNAQRLMSKEYFHFKGHYTGVFSLQLETSASAHNFSNFKWDWLEISNVQKLEERVFEKEKVGDFIYTKIIKPKGRLFGGTEIFIELPDGKSYSSKIYEVVFLEQAGEREDVKSYIRNLGSLNRGNSMGTLTGIVYFSIPKPSSPKPAVVKQEPPKDIVISNQDINVRDEVIEVPDLVVSNNHGINPDIDTTNPAVAAPKGCLMAFAKAFRWIFIVGLVLVLFQFFGRLIKDLFSDNFIESDKKNIVVDDKRLDPKQDTLSPQPWNYLVDHNVEWSDFLPRDYQSHYTTSTLMYEDSRRLHSKWSNAIVQDEFEFWHDLYGDFFNQDDKKLDSLVAFFNNERMTRGLNVVETAEMVTTFIQEIPYVLIHDGSCAEASSQGGFIQEYHSEGKPCLENVVAGVQSPYEFIHDLKGDCDTRSLLGYSILTKMGIASSVWVSREYGHSILGVAVPVNSSNFKKVNGMRHFAVELTAKGFRIGMISPDHTDMDNWNVVLY